MLDRGRVELASDLGEHRVALPAVLGEHAHLDERVRTKRHVDLMDHSRREALLADADNRMQRVRLRAQLATLPGRERNHPRSVARPGFADRPHASL